MAVAIVESTRPVTGASVRTWAPMLLLHWTPMAVSWASSRSRLLGPGTRRCRAGWPASGPLTGSDVRRRSHGERARTEHRRMSQAAVGHLDAAGLIEMWPPPRISMFSFSCPTSTRLIGWLGAPERAQTTDNRRSPDTLIATSLSPSRMRMDNTPASQSTISRRIDEPYRSTGGGYRAQRALEAPLERCAGRGPNRTNPLRPAS